MGGLSAVSYFLITTLFSLIIFVLWARIFIRYFSIGPFSSFSQSINQLTNPLVTPIQQYVLRGKGKKGPYDLACLLLLFCCELFRFFILSALFLVHGLPFFYLFLFALVKMMVEPCNILFFAIIIRVLISWVNPNWQHYFATVVFAITEPLLKRIRRTLPNFGVLDLSPFVALMILKVIELLLLGLLPYALF